MNEKEFPILEIADLRVPIKAKILTKCLEGEILFLPENIVCSLIADSSIDGSRKIVLQTFLPFPFLF